MKPFLFCRNVILPLSFVCCIVVHTSAVPYIGIERDLFWQVPQRLVQSYSAVIVFSKKDDPADKTYPPQSMSNAQLVNLVAIASEEMLEKAGSSAPGAMVALAGGDRIYFASSMRWPGQSWDLDTIAPIMGDWLQLCEAEFQAPHRNQGKCGEFNVLELFFSDKKRDAIRPAHWRIAAWVDDPAIGDHNGPPCSDSKRKWGCQRLVDDYRLVAVSGEEPDESQQDEWDFKIHNPRLCQSEQ